MQTRAASRRRPLPGSPFTNLPAPEIEEYAVEDRVHHDAYGIGRVVTKEDHAVTVDFGARQIRIVSPFAKLTKL